MKILLVCLGNICRSPMADGLLRKKVKENNLSVEVDSAGTSNWHVGKAPDTRMQATGKNNNTPIEFLKARQFKVEDFDEFDRIFAMDKSNYEDIIRLARNEEDKKRVDLFLNLSFPGDDREVPDLYYGGDEGFQHVYDLLDEATDVLIEELKNNE